MWQHKWIILSFRVWLKIYSSSFISFHNVNAMESKLELTFSVQNEQHTASHCINIALGLAQLWFSHCSSNTDINTVIALVGMERNRAF